jgi:hypothetical protein
LAFCSGHRAVCADAAVNQLTAIRTAMVKTDPSFFTLHPSFALTQT